MIRAYLNVSCGTARCLNYIFFVKEEINSGALPCRRSNYSGMPAAFSNTSGVSLLKSFQHTPRKSRSRLERFGRTVPYAPHDLPSP